nr:hypothetical protein [Providencia stuartii]
MTGRIACFTACFKSSLYSSLCKPETVYLIVGIGAAFEINASSINTCPFVIRNASASNPTLAGCFNPALPINSLMRFSCASSLSKSVVSTDTFRWIVFLSDMIVSINEKATSG